MRTRPTYLTLIAVVLLLAVAVAANAAGIVTFYKFVKDPLGNGESDKVAVLYNVESVGKNNISNVTFELKSCYELAACGEIVEDKYVETRCELVRPDPNNDIYGIKFNREIPVGETVTFWVMVSSGDPRRTSEGEYVQAATKSGPLIEYFDVPGFVCEPNDVGLSDMQATGGIDSSILLILYGLVGAAVLAAIAFLLTLIYRSITV